MMRAGILSFIAWLVVSLWSRSLRVRFVNTEARDRLTAEGKNFIYAFWHGNLFLLLHAYRNSKVMIPVSESKDGEIMAGLLNRFGCDVVRGSSARKGHKALIGMISGVRKGRTIGIAVDGPRGPLHEVKKGIVYLAAKQNVPIVPVTTWACRSWVMDKTWEKLVLPVPFTRGMILFGEPLEVTGTSEEELEAGRRKLEQELKRLTRTAQDRAVAAAPAHFPVFGSLLMNLLPQKLQGCRRRSGVDRS